MDSGPNTANSQHFTGTSAKDVFFQIQKESHLKDIKTDWDSAL